MFGPLKSYDGEYSELYEYLTEDWRMKPQFAKAFLDTYKRSIGKILANGKKRMSKLENSANPETALAAFASLGQENALALVGQAYQAYMTDLRTGVHVGTPVETAIWAILVNRSDLLEAIDRSFAQYIRSKHEEEFPRLFQQVFNDNEDT